MEYKIGIDVGSTTVKVVVLSEQNDLLYRSYERHFSQVREKTCELLEKAREIVGDSPVRAVITGSAGLGMATSAGVDFVQEVFATAEAVGTFLPGTDAVVELGGEDAKIIFFGGALEERMNGSCAGGTGAFIDQMATLMNVTAGELDALSEHYEKIYPIASRCGVFAKSDIQPILNQGGRKEDVAASIFQAVVDQTIAGLAQGREIAGQVVFLGGPLHFLKGLRRRFQETLHLDDAHAIFPDDGDCYAAIGAALCSKGYEPTTFADLYHKLDSSVGDRGLTETLPPLFENRAEYDAFCARHNANAPQQTDIGAYEGRAWLGVDAGSTTTKLALVDENGGLLYTYYASNKGNPVLVVLEQLRHIYDLCGDRVTIAGAAATGYGEDLICAAFRFDDGLVETMAHYTAASAFSPDVDFIIDIGGQDMKCFKVRGGAIDSIMLNEACSSGCGSFIETFARALGYEIADFARLGLFAQHPVNLGSRCTVFMNSSVKQAQKDGASVEDISAGLSISIVKNAVYKVIRAASADDLGQHIVVQGGTFHNDAVLRAFELEMGRNVTRPTIAGIMGAYGAALYARRRHPERSTILTREELASFSHTAKPITCGGCTNHCALTVNTFDGGRRFISGNRCQKPLGKVAETMPNLARIKYGILRGYESEPGPRGRVGLPMGLNFYENLPFYHTLLTRLGFEVVLSEESSRALYVRGQQTIPSDTVCYPAKLMHGHIMSLLDQGVDTIFYPCGSYNFDEHIGDNNYNCPVVAYYPELLDANMPQLKNVKFLHPYLGLHRRKDCEKTLCALMHSEFGIAPKQTSVAVHAAFAAYDDYRRAIHEKGQEIIRFAREHGKRILVLAGRPYHIDPEICHGIDELAASYGFCVLTEDAVSGELGYESRHVLNQWSYHSRMYNAARYVCTQPDMEFVQLVSFGCGTDAITTDELRDILEAHGKLYTQLKIDEITNLGAVRIRLRSLIAALDAREGV